MVQVQGKGVLPHAVHGVAEYGKTRMGQVGADLVAGAAPDPHFKHRSRAGNVAGSSV